MTEPSPRSRPLVALADTLKAYRVTGMTDGLRLTLTAEVAEALEDVLRLTEDYEARMRDREATLAASVTKARTELRRARRFLAEAGAHLDRIRREAISIVAWSCLLSIVAVAWAWAIAAGLGL